MVDHLLGQSDRRSAGVGLGAMLDRPPDIHWSGPSGRRMLHKQPSGLFRAAAAWCALFAMASGCDERHSAVSPQDCGSVPCWANPVEEGCWPWSGGGPETPRFPNSQDEPCWSNRGLIVYVDNGIVAVDPRTGYCSVDPLLAGLWVIDPRTESRSRIWSSGRNPCWSPDGLMIAFIDSNSLCTIDYRGGQYRRLTSGEWNNNPAWSRDGSTLAYESDSGVAADFGIWLRRIADGDAWRVTDGGVRYPEWLLGDNGLMVIRTVDGIGQICRMDPTGNNVVTLSWFPEGRDVRYNRLSPDGRRIAYTNYVPDNCRRQMWILDIGGKVDYRITWEGGASPAWSQDGTLIVYVKEDATKYDGRVGTLWIMNSMTGEEWQLTSTWVSGLPPTL